MTPLFQDFRNAQADFAITETDTDASSAMERQWAAAEAIFSDSFIPMRIKLQVALQQSGDSDLDQLQKMLTTICTADDQLSRLLVHVPDEAILPLSVAV